MIFTQCKMITGISAFTQKRTPRSLNPHKSKQDGEERLVFHLLNHNTSVLAAIYSGTWLKAEKCTLGADVQPDNITVVRSVYKVCVKTASWTEIDFLFLTFWNLHRHNSIWAANFIRAVRKCDREIASYETERERLPLGSWEEEEASSIVSEASISK